MIRFAPSPTDAMRIGDLYIALLNYLNAKKSHEDFLVRIEDLDTTNSKELKDEEILDILALFNIHYSQVIHQSQNVRFHSAMALQLMHEKRAFSCFCSDGWLQARREEAEKASKEYFYDDACRNLPAELVIDNTNPFSIRIARPQKTLTVHDKRQGNIEFDPNTIDSFVIMTQEKHPTLDFAAAVDDMLNDITFIIRDEKNLTNSARQEHIRRSLAYDKELEFLHVPSFSDDVKVKDLLEEGYLPEAILNYLISTALKGSQEIFTLEEAVEIFSLENISTADLSFDKEKLKEINRAHLKQLDPRELSRYVGFADDDIGHLAAIYLEDVATTRELKEKIEPIFSGSRDIPSSLNKEAVLLVSIIKSAPYFEEYGDFKEYIMKNSQLSEEKCELLFTLLLTDSSEVTNIESIYKHLKNYIGEIIK